MFSLPPSRKVSKHPMPDLNDFAESCRRYMQAELDKFQAQRDRLCAVLSSHKIAKVTIKFDGNGDDGQIYDIAYSRSRKTDTKDFGKTEVPGTEAERWTFDANGSDGLKVRCQTIDEGIDDMCYSLLSSKYGGWEINEGSFGTIVLDVATKKITVSFNRRMMEVDSEEGEF